MAIDGRVVSADTTYDVGTTTDFTMSPAGRLRVEALQVDATGNPAYPLNVSRIVSAAASTNPTVAKASAGRAFRVTGFNANAAARYLKIYNKATAPTVGTDVPVHTEYLAPQSKFAVDLAGMRFAAGIAYALTTGSADNDTGALTAADVLALNLSYS